MSLQNESRPSTERVRTVAMRGAVLHHVGADLPYGESRPISILDLELEGPGPGEVMVKIHASSVCHSDLSVLNGTRPREVPLLLGHESAGTVVQVGEGVVDLTLGQHVVLTFLPGCEDCEGCRTKGQRPCITGSAANAAGTLLGGHQRIVHQQQRINHHLGVSGFANYATVHASSAIPIDDDVPLEIAALFGCAVLTGGGAVLNAGRPTPEDTVAVVGLGGVGMAAILTAQALGVRKVVGVDLDVHKHDLATEIANIETYTPQDVEASRERFDLVIEAAGHARAFETAVDITQTGGTTVTVGLPDPSATAAVHPAQLTAEARKIIGSYLGSAVPKRDIPRFIELWRTGKLPIEKLITSFISLDNINEAMDELDKGTALRQVILFNSDSE